jgi:hypothetical protein
MRGILGYAKRSEASTRRPALPSERSSLATFTNTWRRSPQTTKMTISRA